MYMTSYNFFGSGISVYSTKIGYSRKGCRGPSSLGPFLSFRGTLHYLLFLPYGALGWSPNRLNAAEEKFSKARWYRARFLMNAEQMSFFPSINWCFDFLCMTYYYKVNIWSMPGVQLKK
jgi:hypothetical protein